MMRKRADEEKPRWHLGISQKDALGMSSYGAVFNAYAGDYPQAGGQYKGYFGTGSRTELYRPKGENTTYKITPEMIPYYSATKQLTDKAFPQWSQRRRRVSKPLTPRELMTINTGDPTYPDRAMKHLGSIPNSYYEESGFLEKSPFFSGVAADYLNSPFTVTYDPKRKGGSYNPRSGEIVVGRPSPPLPGWLPENVKGFSNCSLRPLNDYPDKRSDVGSSIFHEAGHRSQMTPTTMTELSSKIVQRTANPEEEKMFIGMMRAPVGVRKNYDELRDTNALDDYALDTEELMQSHSAFVQGRLGLQNALRKNGPARWINGNYNSGMLNEVLGQQELYKHTPEDESAYERDLRWYKNNPAYAKLLGPEAQRHIFSAGQILDHYDKMKPKWEKISKLLAETPEKSAAWGGVARSYKRIKKEWQAAEAAKKRLMYVRVLVRNKGQQPMPGMWGTYNQSASRVG